MSVRVLQSAIYNYFTQQKAWHLEQNRAKQAFAANQAWILKKLLAHLRRLSRRSRDSHSPGIQTLKTMVVGPEWKQRGRVLALEDGDGQLPLCLRPLTDSSCG